MRFISLLASFLLISTLATACGDDDDSPGLSPDTALTEPDAALDSDDPSNDAALDSENTAAVEDTGAEGDVAPDTLPTDTNVADDASDSGEDLDVAPDVVDDAQPDGVDQDAGDLPEETDTGMDPADNVIPNWDFEIWQDSLPVSWLGLESNLSSDSVEDVTTDVYTGAHAVRLSNTSSSHRRFTTAPLTLAAGRYQCTVEVRGQGELRGGFYGYTDFRYGSYHTIDTAQWQTISYEFNARDDTNADAALIFSLRNTVAPEHLVLDHVVCVRQSEACDIVTCDEWASCDPQTVQCEPLQGRCGAPADCLEWEDCDGTNTCVLADGRCESTADCDVAGATPVCDTTAHTCVAGDPCDGVTCDEWRECDPADQSCVLSDGRCMTTANCVGASPVCDTANHRCEASDHPANIFPNGGFEVWSDWDIPFHGTHYIPDEWYGVFDDLTDDTGASELDPAALAPYTAAPHSGTTALQVTFTAPMNADRLASEDFDISSGSYSCAYWVRGKGSVRHRGYSSGGWAPQTDFRDFDTEQWEQVLFDVPGNVRGYRLIFYVSGTDAARDHIQIDDVVCSAN